MKPSPISISGQATAWISSVSDKIARDKTVPDVLPRVVMIASHRQQFAAQLDLNN